MGFSPSNAHRWVGGGCTGSVAAEAAAYRRPRTDSANEGNRLHALAARTLSGDRLTISTEDNEQIEPYVNAVRDYEHFEGSTLEVEFEIHGHEVGIDSGKVDSRVKVPDRWVYFDAKFGHRTVEVFENWQLITSAVMDPPPPDVRAVACIVQPNGYHPDGPVRFWTMPDLAPYRARIVQAIDDAKHRPRLVATPSNCTYCQAVTSCPAARTATLGGYDMAMRDTGKLPADEVRTELVTLRTAGKLIQTRLDALEVEAEARMRGGESLAGCRMSAGRGGKRVWDKSAEQIAEYCAGAGVKITKAPEMLTPSQAIKAGVPEKIIDGMSKRQPSKMSVQTDASEFTKKAFQNVEPS